MLRAEKLVDGKDILFGNVTLSRRIDVSYLCLRIGCLFVQVTLSLVDERCFNIGLRIFPPCGGSERKDNLQTSKHWGWISAPYNKVENVVSLNVMPPRTPFLDLLKISLLSYFLIFFSFKSRFRCSLRMSPVCHVFSEMDSWIPMESYAHGPSICGQICPQMSSFTVGGFAHTREGERHAPSEGRGW